MVVCSPNFYGDWEVKYLDETQYSGEMSIYPTSAAIVVVGTIKKNGTIDGSYQSTDASCLNTTSMEFTYELDDGYKGTIRLGVVNNFKLDGFYKDFGNGGDQGKVELNRI